MQMILVLFRLPKAMQAVTKAMPDTTIVFYYKLTAICAPISYLTVFGDLWNNQVLGTKS